MQKQPSMPRQKDAEAAYLAQNKESEGLMEMAKAYGALATVMGGPASLMNYLMLQNNVYEKLAVQNAKAINGLQPKINVWNTGNQEGVDSAAPIRNLFQSLPPLLSTRLGCSHLLGWRRCHRDRMAK